MKFIMIALFSVILFLVVKDMLVCGVKEYFATEPGDGWRANAIITIICGIILSSMSLAFICLVISDPLGKF